MKVYKIDIFKSLTPGKKIVYYFTDTCGFKKTVVATLDDEDCVIKYFNNFLKENKEESECKETTYGRLQR